MTVIHTLIETKDGSLAAATADHGLYLIFPGQGSLQFCRTNGFPDDWITGSLCEDREGNLWVGTGNSGLAMLRPERHHPQPARSLAGTQGSLRCRRSGWRVVDWH
jgi:ligand-binding sensor domain-containing protein